MAVLALYLFGLLFIGSIIHLVNLWNLSFSKQMTQAQRERIQFQQKQQRERYSRQQRKQYNDYKSYTYTRDAGEQRQDQQRRYVRRRGKGADHYGEVLGVNPETVNTRELKQAYRKLVTQYHPDKVHHKGEEYRQVAEQKIKEVNEAYDYFRKKYRI